MEPQQPVLHPDHDADGYHDIGAYPAAETEPGLIIYRFDAPLYFPNVPYFMAPVRSIVDAADPPARWVLLNVEAVTYIDATAVDALRRLHDELAARDITLAVARCARLVS